MPDTSNKTKGKTLFVSDFDDTLAQTDSKVYLIRNGRRVVMDPAQFATYEAQPGDEFDFGEFDQLINPKPIERFVKLIKRAASGKADKVVVLTARGHTAPVSKFLKMHDINSGVVIAALGDANPQKKANYIQKHIEHDGYNRVAFIDDSKKNIEAVKLLQNKFPDVKILTHQAKEHPSDVNQSISKMEIRPLEGKDELAKAKDWILNKHYIRRWPTAVQAKLGVYVNDKLQGVLLYGATIRPTAARETFKNDDGSPAIQNNQMWELLRAYTTPEAKIAVPNLGSMAIAQGNDYIRTQAKTTDGKPIKAILTYADSDVGHAGGVYKATNATYLGKQRPLPVFVVTNPKNGESYEMRTMTKNAQAKLESMGLQVTSRKGSGKHKYVYVMGKDQTERDQLMSRMSVPIFDYPKEGQPQREIPNAAKERLAKKKPTQTITKDPEKKSAIIKKLLNSKVKNPETGNDILVKTALKYDKSHPSYKQAKGMVTAYSKKYNIHVKSTR